MSESIITLDVREDLRNGIEPFSKIMSSAKSLQKDQKLRLIAPFEPVPLYGVLAQLGFSHESRLLTDGNWEVLFSNSLDDSAAASQSPDFPQSKSDCPGLKIVKIDVRNMEPPAPLVKILEAVAELPKGHELRAHTDRKPMHLYAQLEERGFTGQTDEQPDGSFITRIRSRL